MRGRIILGMLLVALLPAKSMAQDDDLYFTPKDEPVEEPAEEPVVDAEKPAEGTYVVKAGDNLWKIAKEQLGDGKLWSSIYELNKDQIADPGIITIGQELVIK